MSNLILFPDWIFYLVLIFTIIILIVQEILKTIPTIKKFGYVITPLGIITICFCVFSLTTRYNNTIWNQKLSNINVEMEQLKLKSEIVNERIVWEVIEIPVERIIERNKIIKEQIPVYIKEENDCPVPVEVIQLYNQSIGS